MTPEELDQWRGQEAWRLRHEYPEDATEVIAARLAREGRKPPAPVVDPDVLAWRERAARRSEANGSTDWASSYRQGRLDLTDKAQAYLAGARMATERERERAKVLEAYVKLDEHGPHLWTRERARKVLAKYRGEA